MSIIAIPFVFSPGTTIVSSQVNSCNSVIYNDYNGNIGNSNLSSSVVITDNKLAQITSASKVSGTALTLLGNIPSGAGVVPTANLPVGTTIGDVVQIANVGGNPFIPTSIIGALFGTWTSQSLGTIYQAATDGIVTCYSSISGSAAQLNGVTDSNATPSTLRAQSYPVTSQNAYISFPVRKNDYYQCTMAGSTSSTMFFLPTSS